MYSENSWKRPQIKTNKEVVKKRNTIEQKVYTKKTAKRLKRIQRTPAALHYCAITRVYYWIG